MLETYCDSAFVDTFSADSGQDTRWLALTDEDKTYILYLSTIDIIKHHEQPMMTFETPWEFGNAHLEEACGHQALHVARTIGPREWQERAKVMSNSGFSDMIISTSKFGRVGLMRMAAVLVDRVVMEVGEVIAQRTFGRG